jgi:pimeloyl-ACP methyl ester carboxylesterase
MTIAIDRLEAALRDALDEPGLRADAQRCRTRIELVGLVDAASSTEDTDRHVLWSGVDGGAAVALIADTDTWSEVFSPLPPPGRQSIGALRRQCSSFAIEGADLVFAQTLPFIERLVERVRARYNDAIDDIPLDHDELAFIRGSYVPLRTSAGRDWVQVERSGSEDAAPLLMLHTAGADTRQWHGLMGHAALRDAWSMHAFDLPGHGRSPLPKGEANWDWRLTEARYVDWVVAYLDAAKLDKVALIGCSMGSAIGLALLAQHPQRFAGAVLLEPPYRSPGRRSPYLNHPEVHGARLGAAWVGSLLSPSSPKARRDEAMWIYSQAAPSVYEGDLIFYSDEFDAAHHTSHISTRETPLWLMTGNYDYSATCDDARRIATEVPGARFTELPGFGHFPMVENPLCLVPFLEPALLDIRKRFD